MPLPKQVTGKVFSAKTFFAQVVAGTPAPSGLVDFCINFPHGTFTDVHGATSSLYFIDGFCAEALLQQKFTKELAIGAIPSPLPHSTARPLLAQVACIAPESLLLGQKTLLAALGVIPQVIEALQQMQACSCPHCHSQSAIYTSPSELLNAVAQDWQGQTISVYAQSTEPKLVQWTCDQGLSQTTTENGSHSVLLDKIICDPNSLRSISRLIHSAWRLPGICFICATSDNTTLSYGPGGWCRTCGSLGIAPRPHTELRTILTRGIPPAETQSSEIYRLLSPTISIEQLMTLPLRALHLEKDSPLSFAHSLLLKSGFANRSFSSATSALHALELTKLSLVSSILYSIPQDTHIVVDIPTNLLRTEDAATMSSLQLQPKDKERILLFGHLCTQVTNSVDSPPSKKGRRILSIPNGGHSEKASLYHDLHLGDLWRISMEPQGTVSSLNSLIGVITSLLEETQQNALVRAIPVFPDRTKNYRVVGELLGILPALAQLYSASLDARIHGLTPKDFILFGTRTNRFRCNRCYGLGVLLAQHETLPRPLATACPVCKGLRCHAPLSSALFRGVPFSTALNQDIELLSSSLVSLPQGKRTLHIISALSLQHIPLGMPVALLSRSEYRRMLIAQAILQTRSSKPTVVLVEEPTACLSAAHFGAVRKLRDETLQSATCAWVELYAPATSGL